jgi:hypothetical protein
VALVPDGYDGRFRFVAPVLDSPEQGPRILLGAGVVRLSGLLQPIDA